jgi:hypothetical protein
MSESIETMKACTVSILGHFWLMALTSAASAILEELQAGRQQSLRRGSSAARPNDKRWCREGMGRVAPATGRSGPERCHESVVEPPGGLGLEQPRRACWKAGQTIAEAAHGDWHTLHEHAGYRKAKSSASRADARKGSKCG